MTELVIYSKLTHSTVLVWGNPFPYVRRKLYRRLVFSAIQVSGIQIVSSDALTKVWVQALSEPLANVIGTQ
jgi:hypothetical protein